MNRLFKVFLRKVQYIIFNVGARGLFRQIGSEMVEDDCPDAQFSLANKLLTKPCGKITRQS